MIVLYNGASHDCAICGHLIFISSLMNWFNSVNEAVLLKTLFSCLIHDSLYPLGCVCVCVGYCLFQELTLHGSCICHIVMRLPFYFFIYISNNYTFIIWCKLVVLESIPSNMEFWKHIETSQDRGELLTVCTKGLCTYSDECGIVSHLT